MHTHCEGEYRQLEKAMGVRAKGAAWPRYFCTFRSHAGAGQGHTTQQCTVSHTVHLPSAHC